MRAGLVFPHQLFEGKIFSSACDTVYLVEEWLYFRQYNFHKRKIAYQRAGMKYYEEYLGLQGYKTEYIDSFHELADIRKLIASLAGKGFRSIEYTDSTDYWLDLRTREACHDNGVELIQHKTPMFINTPQELFSYFNGRKKMFQTDFYKDQRIRRNLLIDLHSGPVGGRWSYDDENRLRFPKGKLPPGTKFTKANKFHGEAEKYTLQYFGSNYGELNQQFLYPVTHTDSRKWLQDFFEQRFAEFGPYEDAIVAGEHFINHSVLTPMLNTGLLTPGYVIDEAINYAVHHTVPINSLEGFIRQVLGWREYMRAVYQLRGREERTKNYWGFTRKIPASFWEAKTGIEPLDITIRKILDTGYCHHIERLMVLGNFMLLCEFDPDEVYRWFMELFIDAYDWVMVPNVYGMSQFADGGMMSTKPYISGSNYLMKMSDYRKGEWQEVWDGLFWRFMHVHRDFFTANPRIGMLVKTFDKMPAAKQKEHISRAENFLLELR